MELVWPVDGKVFTKESLMVKEQREKYDFSLREMDYILLTLCMKQEVVFIPEH